MTSPRTLRILAGALAFSVCVGHPVRGQEPTGPDESATWKTQPAEAAGDRGPADRNHKENERTGDTENKLGGSLVKNIALDQKAIWTSPARLGWRDANWLVPLGGVTAALISADSSSVRAINLSLMNVKRS